MTLLRLATTISLLGLCACLPPEQVSPTTTEGGTTDSGRLAPVTRVYDGDTIEALIEGRAVDVRLDGINAPDRDECYYRPATDRLRDLVDGKEVTIETTGTDQFGRTLAHIWESGTHINLALVASGHAIATTPLEPTIAEAEREASGDRIGLWSPNVCGTGPLPAIDIDTVRSVVDPPGPDDQVLDEEVIYLKNTGTTPVNMTGWVLRDESSRHRYHFADGVALGPGESLAVRSDDTSWNPGDSPVWSNDGDIIMLLDRDGRVITSRRY